MEPTLEKSQARTLPSLWWAMFLISFPFGILGFVMPIYGKELGASAVEIGGLFSALALVPVVVRPFLGRALDRWGRRPFLLLGLGGYVAAMIVFCLSNTVALLTTARFIQGLGQAFLWLAAITIVADVASATGRGRDFGQIDEGVNRGALIGTALGFAAIFTLAGFKLKLTQAWFWLFLAYTIPALIAFAIAWRGIGETRPDATRAPIVKRPFSRQLVALMGIVFATGASSAMVWPLLMIFLQDHLHADIRALGFAYLPAALISSFLPSRLGHIADRWGRKLPMIGGLIVGALASALIPHLGSLVALAILWAVESASYAAATPAERAFVADIAGQDVRGSSYGLYTFAYFLGAAVGPLAGGWLYDNTNHAMPFYLNTVVLLIGAVLVATVLRETRGVKRDA
ncbi:MAG: MFS transporter [Anaerolineales bacterium]|nr:MFS transporter [Anaerolineales bacterium]